MNTSIPNKCPDWCEQHHAGYNAETDNHFVSHSANLYVRRLPAFPEAAPVIHLYVSA